MAAHLSPPTVGAYLRISVDDDPDRPSTSPERQLEDIRRLAENKGWVVAEVYEDRDLSAWRRNVKRPGYERMLEDLKAGHIGGVVIWKLDRLVRRITEFSRFWNVCESAGAILAAVNDPIDTSTPLGLAVVYLLVAVAETESRNTSLRTTRAEQEKAKHGVPKITSVRPYGFTADWSAIVPEEAEIIREAADRILAGESLKSVCVDLNERHVPTSNNGDGWRPFTLRYLLTSPRLWGQRIYKGEIVGPGSWPAILDADTGEKLVALFSSRSTGKGGPPRRALLSGILHCGNCGQVMKAGRNGRQPGTTGPETEDEAEARRRYVCPSKPEGCGTISIKAVPVEQYLTEAVLTALAGPMLQQHLRQGDDEAVNATAAELEALRNRLTELAEMWSVGEITRAEWLAARRPMQARVEAIEQQLAQQVHGNPLAALIGVNDIRQTWDDELDDEQRRAIMLAVLERVDVQKASYRGEPFSPDRVSSPIWAA
jgi:DNA invertase Pin-like site-specific DNA recombinase